MEPDTWEEIVEAARKTTKARCLNCRTEGLFKEVFVAQEDGIGYTCRKCSETDEEV